MLQALKPFNEHFPFDVEVIDVDADNNLVELYDELVPVLVGWKDDASAPVQLCHYFLDEKVVLAFLNGND